MGVKKRRNRPAAAADPRPVADMPLRLQVYEPADWLPDGLALPEDRYDVAAWQAWERAHRDAYGAFHRAVIEWHAQHRLPPLNVDELPDDEPFTPPPSKVDPVELAALESNRRPGWGGEPGEHSQRYGTRGTST